MPVKSDDPLRRVTLNLYEADCLHLERTKGQGWTTYVRELVQRDCNTDRRVEHTLRTTLDRPRTLGDLADD